MESIPDGQGALLELEALEMWKEFFERDSSPVVEMLEIEDDRPWWEDFQIGSVEGQGEENQGVPLVTQLPDFLPLEEVKAVVVEEDRDEMAQDEDISDPDFIPDGQEEWLQMERKAGRYYD
ncbi:unnamed protein product [Caenorhabditis brenneri]